jgi:hypothetical protein
MQDAITTTDGVLLLANGIDKVLRWDGFSSEMESAGIVQPTQAVTIAASGSGSITGTYYAFLRFVDKYGNVSNMSPAGTPAVAAGNGTVTYTNLATSDEAKVVSRQLWRNTAGQTAVFYLDVQSDDLAATSLTSTKTDAELRTQESVALFDSTNNELADTNDPPPSTKRFLASHLGRAWMAGEQLYSEGAVKVTSGSTTVTGVMTAWPTTFEGRFLWVKGAAKAYEIDAVDADEQVLVLVEPFVGRTDQFSAYTIRPPLPERRQVLFSPAGRPESWPPTQALEIPDSNDEITGLLASRSFLFVTEKRQSWRISAQEDPAVDGQVFQAASRGCVNQRCWSLVDEMVVALDRQGVYAVGAGSATKSLSDAIDTVFYSGGGDNTYRVRWEAEHWFHSVFDRGRRVVRFFVTLSGSGQPRHALCLAIDSGRWWVEEYPFKIGSSCVAVIDGHERVCLGGPAGSVFVLGPDSLEMVTTQKGKIRGSVTSASLLSLTDALAGFGSDLAGAPVMIVSGRGKRQWRLVTAATPTRLTVDRPWSEMPDRTSVYQVGGVRWKYRTGWTRWGKGEEEKPRRLELLFEPVGRESVMNARIYLDRSRTPQDWESEYTSDDADGMATERDSPDLVADLTKPLGFVQKRMDGFKDVYADGPRLLSWELDGVTNKDTVHVYELNVDGAVQPGE